MNDDLFELLERHTKLNEQLNVVDDWLDKNSNVHTLVLNHQLWEFWKSYIPILLTDFPETRKAEVCQWCIQKLKFYLTQFSKTFKDEGDELLISKKEFIEEGFYKRKGFYIFTNWQVMQFKSKILHFYFPQKFQKLT